MERTIQDFYFKGQTRQEAHENSVRFLNDVIKILQERRGFLSHSDVERLIDGETLTYSSQNPVANNVKVFYRGGFEISGGKVEFQHLVAITGLNDELYSRFRSLKEGEKIK